MAKRSEMSDGERQELIAYLDQELDPQERDRLEARLATDASAAAEAEVLRRTWECLDWLPMPEAKKDFTERTLVVSGLAQQLKATGSAPSGLAAVTVPSGLGPAERTQTGPAENRLGTRVLMLWGMGIAACLAIGIVAGRSLPDPNGRLSEDLPIVERFDEYRAARDIEFVRQLHDSGLLEAMEEPFLVAPPARGKER